MEQVAKYRGELEWGEIPMAGKTVEAASLLPEGFRPGNVAAVIVRHGARSYAACLRARVPATAEIVRDGSGQVCGIPAVAGGSCAARGIPEIVDESENIKGYVMAMMREAAIGNMVARIEANYSTGSIGSVRTQTPEEGLDDGDPPKDGHGIIAEMSPYGFWLDDHPELGAVEIEPECRRNQFATHYALNPGAGTCLADAGREASAGELATLREEGATLDLSRPVRVFSDEELYDALDLEEYYGDEILKAQEAYAGLLADVTMVDNVARGMRLLTESCQRLAGGTAEGIADHSDEIEALVRGMHVYCALHPGEAHQSLEASEKTGAVAVATSPDGRSCTPGWVSLYSLDSVYLGEELDERCVENASIAGFEGRLVEARNSLFGLDKVGREATLAEIRESGLDERQDVRKLTDAEVAGCLYSPETVIEAADGAVETYRRFLHRMRAIAGMVDESDKIAGHVAKAHEIGCLGGGSAAVEVDPETGEIGEPSFFPSSSSWTGGLETIYSCDGDDWSFECGLEWETFPGKGGVEMYAVVLDDEDAGRSPTHAELGTIREIMGSPEGGVRILTKCEFYSICVNDDYLRVDVEEAEEKYGRILERIRDRDWEDE